MSQYDDLKDEITLEQYNSLVAFCKKAREKKWRICKERKDWGRKSTKHGTLYIDLYDSSKNRHFLQIAKDGEITFAPVTFVFGGGSGL